MRKRVSAAIVISLGVLLVLVYLLIESRFGPQVQTTVEVRPSIAEPSAPLTDPLPIPVEFDAFVDVEAERQLAVLKAKQEIPPHPWHVERVKTISSENIDDLIRNMANRDDWLFASTPSGGIPPSIDSVDSIHITLPRLFRVRRLLEISETEPQTVRRAVEQALRDALAQWPEAFKQEKTAWIQSDETGIPLDKTEPSSWDQAKLRAQASTYILAELGDPTSLPLLLESQRVQNQWIAEIPEEDYSHIAQTPVPPVTTLYAMHRLFLNVSASSLPPEARESHRQYMEWAEQNIQPATLFQGVKSTALYDESDPRNTLMDPRGFLTYNEPKLTLAQYPLFFTDGSTMAEYPAAPYMSERCDTWFGLIEKFVTSAFAGAKTASVPIVAGSLNAPN